MYEIIKSVIESKDYKLEDILYKINKMWIESAINEEQKTELDSLARENANAVNSYAPLQKQINNIYTELDSIKSRLNVLEGTEEPAEPDIYNQQVLTMLIIQAIRLHITARNMFVKWMVVYGTQTLIQQAGKKL